MPPYSALSAKGWIGVNHILASCPRDKLTIAYLADALKQMQRDRVLCLSKIVTCP